MLAVTLGSWCTFTSFSSLGDLVLTSFDLFSPFTEWGGARYFKSFLEAFLTACSCGNDHFILIWLPYWVCLPTATSILFLIHFLDHLINCGCLLCRVVNEPLEIISTDLGFSGNTLAEGKIVYLVLNNFALEPDFGSDFALIMKVWS